MTEILLKTNHRTLKIFFLALALSFSIFNSLELRAASGILVLETDFGVKDAAVSAMKGVIYSVDKDLVVSDLTHEIPAYNIWDAAYRLQQAASYWPEGTVFVSVIDPGVGTLRKSIVAKSKNGQFFVSPDNGTLTLVEESLGFSEVREIDESKHRLKGSNNSYTFYGRDLYSHTGAKLAAKKISFDQVGPKLEQPIVKLSYSKAKIDLGILKGNIASLDPQYGNVWTNISSKLAENYGMFAGNKYKVKIFYKGEKKYEAMLPFKKTFGEVPEGSDLFYTNSLMNISIATNMGNFAQSKKIESGSDWTIEIDKN
ncbi:MAG: S-adenosyl-l-methionine hydroxide adenosyltransferase family protein [Deltaproteobacteria bacterium]|nr:S-adenosyl-l-methionine hydroxide adenosyltransferase family protein [Deltaproteobacteria bacterium]